MQPHATAELKSMVLTSKTVKDVVATVRTSPILLHTLFCISVPFLSHSFLSHSFLSHSFSYSLSLTRETQNHGEQSPPFLAHTHILRTHSHIPRTHTHILLTHLTSYARTLTSYTLLTLTSYSLTLSIAGSETWSSARGRGEQSHHHAGPYRRDHHDFLRALHGLVPQEVMASPVHRPPHRRARPTEGIPLPTMFLSVSRYFKCRK